MIKKEFENMACVTEQTTRFVRMVYVMARDLLSRTTLHKLIMSRNTVHMYTVHICSLRPASCSYPDVLFHTIVKLCLWSRRQYSFNWSLRFCHCSNLSLETAQGWRNMLFALSLLNETVTLLSPLESIGSEDFKVKLKRIGTEKFTLSIRCH